MSITHQLENLSASETFDLTAVEMDGSLISYPSQGRVIETMRIMKQDPFEVNIRSAIISLEKMLLKAVRWHQDELETDSIWLRRNVYLESARRSLVYDFSMQPLDDGIFGRHLLNQAGMWSLAITRHQAWEPTTPVTTTETTISDLGGTINLTTIHSGGTLDNRISLVTVNPDTYDYTKMWIGIRPIGPGVAGFYPKIECEDGTGLTDTSSQSVTNASGGFAMQTTFATVATMAYRFWTKLSDTAGADPADYIGRYLVLMRAKVGAGTTVAARLVTSFGQPSSTNPQQRSETQYLTNTSLSLIPMGEIAIPPGGPREWIDGYNLDNFALSIEAERISGSGSLYCDAFVLIPSAHHITWQDGLVEATVDIARVFTHENDVVHAYAYQISNDNIKVMPSLSVNNWQIPKDGGFLVFAAQDPTTEVIDTAGVAVHSYKRYLSYR